MCESECMCVCVCVCVRVCVYAPVGLHVVLGHDVTADAHVVLHAVGLLHERLRVQGMRIRQTCTCKAYVYVQGRRRRRT